MHPKVAIVGFAIRPRALVTICQGAISCSCHGCNQYCDERKDERDTEELERPIYIQVGEILFHWNTALAESRQSPYVLQNGWKKKMSPCYIRHDQNWIRASQESGGQDREQNNTPNRENPCHESRKYSAQRSLRVQMVIIGQGCHSLEIGW